MNTPWVQRPWSFSGPLVARVAGTVQLVQLRNVGRFVESLVSSATAIAVTKRLAESATPCGVNTGNCWFLSPYLSPHGRGHGGVRYLVFPTPPPVERPMIAASERP